MREYEYALSERKVYIVKGDAGDEWYWEITTFQSGDRCFGVAQELTRDLKTNVIEILGVDLTRPILELCNEIMEDYYNK